MGIVNVPLHHALAKKPEPVTMQAPAPVRTVPPKDCGCGKRTPRFPKPLPRPEDTK